MTERNDPNKTWFITGAARGFGHAFATAAPERGDRVAATARDTTSLAALAAAHGDLVLALPLDVTDRAAATRAVDDAHRHFGRLDVVVNNATPQDERVRAVVERLNAESAEFRELWARNDARLERLRVKGFRHPVVGELTLRMETFDVRSAPGQELLVYHAEPDSPSAAVLARLAELAAPH